MATLESTTSFAKTNQVKSNNALKEKTSTQYGTVTIGDCIRIIKMDNRNGFDRQADAHNGKEGVIEMIDDKGQLHGTWGGLAVIPFLDEFEIIV